MSLELQNCSLSFGGIKALTDFSARLGEGEILGVIGPNGAGKTTLFNVITGVYCPDQGDVLFNSDSIAGKSLHEINRLGIARTFQNIRLFQNLTVEENVLIAFHHTIRSNLIQFLFQTPKSVHEEDECAKKAEALLQLFKLNDKKGQLAKNLPYGDQRRLEIVRALATNPRILLLDEPAAGMNATEKQELIQLIRSIQKDFNLGVLLIEHDMSVVMTLCPKLIVLDYGQVIATGSPDEIRKNPKVIEAYLGEKVPVS